MPVWGLGDQNAQAHRHSKGLATQRHWQAAGQVEKP